MGVGLVWQQLQCVGGARAGGGGGRQHSALCDVVCFFLSFCLSLISLISLDLLFSLFLSFSLSPSLSVFSLSVFSFL